MSPPATTRSPDTRPSNTRAVDPGFLALVVVFAIYAIAWIVRTSFIVEGVRYFTLADDQMISMRYAENLARGYGLVWNPGGPRIEGFTNFLWVVYMAVFHLLRVPKPQISAAIQVSGVLFLVANLYCVKRLAERLSQDSQAVALTAVALVAFYLPLDNWAFQGTEVSVLALVVTSSAFLALEVLEEQQSPALLYVVLAASTLIRPDMIIIAVAFLVALFTLEDSDRRRHVFLGGAAIGAMLALETILRQAYFGDLLPNTYYLKLTGFPLLPRVTRGLLVTLRFVASILPMLLPLFLARMPSLAARGLRLLAIVVGIQVAYNIWIGGDAWEWWGGSNRFVSVVMPLVCVAVALALGQIWRAPARVSIAARIAMVTVTVIASDYLAFAASGNPLARLTLTAKPPETDQDEARVRAAVALRGFTDDDAVVAVITAGAIPYFSERQSIDVLGKMDARIAHEPMHVPQGAGKWTGFLPGHLKWDYQYSIGELKPDVIQGRGDNARENPPEFVLRDYREIVAEGRWYVRKQSPHVSVQF